MYTIWEIETQNLWLTQMPSQGEMADRNIFVCLSLSTGFLWNNLWSVSRYVMGPLSGRWRQKGNDQQCLTAPIWKYRSGFGDHRFTFFIDLRQNYTFYTNLTNIVHWVVAYRDVAHLVRLNLEKKLRKVCKIVRCRFKWLIEWEWTREHSRRWISNWEVGIFAAFDWEVWFESRYMHNDHVLLTYPLTHWSLWGIYE